MDRVSEEFLHRGAQGDEGKGRCGGAGKVPRPQEGLGIAEQAHWRRVMQEPDPRIARGQRMEGAGPHADDRDSDALQPRQ